MTSVVIISDLHINSKLALFPPSFVDDSGMVITQNKIQQWLWDSWLDFWQYVASLRNGKLIVILSGDIFEGDHHNTSQIVSHNMADQDKMLEEVVKPILDQKPDYSFFVRGTQVHAGEAGQFEEMAARWFSNQTKVEQEPETGNYSWWWLPLETDGVKFDIAHHGRGGMRPWTANNAANILAAELVFDYCGAAWTPDIAVRSHVHYKSDTGDNFPIRVIYTPSWQQSTAHGHKIKPGLRKLQAGGIIVNCDNGQYEVHKKTYCPPLQEVWREPNGSDTRGIVSGIAENIKRIWRA